MGIQFWEYPEPTGNSWTIPNFESYINSVHKQYWVSDTCGIDQYWDLHFGYSPSGRYKSTDINVYASRAKKSNYIYHWWGHASQANFYALYIPDPTGWVFTIYGSSQNAPKTVANYTANCSDSVSGCSGKGYCPKKSKSREQSILTDILDLN